MAIRDNTVELQAILDTVNNLPEAGGGATPTEQTVTVTCICDTYGLNASKEYAYTSGELVVITTENEWCEIVNAAGFTGALATWPKITISGVEDAIKLCARGSNQSIRIAKGTTDDGYSYAMVFVMPQNNVTVTINTAELY